MSELTITRGDDRTISATVRDENAAIVNLTGALAVTFSIRTSPTGTAVLARTLGSGISIPTPANGIIVITLTAAQTAVLSGSYFFDLVLKDAASITTTVNAGTLLVNPAEAVVGIDMVRGVLTTALLDDDLREVIFREEAELAALIGPLAGERTETFYLTSNMASSRITLRRPTNAVEVVDHGDAVLDDDIRLMADQRTMLRLLTGATLPYEYGYWLGPVEATYTPNDLARVRRVLIELVGIGISAVKSAVSGDIVSETTGTYSYTLGRTALASLTPEQRRRSLYASLLPKQLPTSVHVRSSIIGRRGLLGTVRP